MYPGLVETFRQALPGGLDPIIGIVNDDLPSTRKKVADELLALGGDPFLEFLRCGAFLAWIR